MRTPPASLVDAIRSDLRPVRPIAAPAVRAAAVALVALASGAILIAAIGIRDDYFRLPAVLFAAQVILRVIAALALLWVALLEGTPSAGLPRRLANSVLAVSLVLLVALPVHFAQTVGASSSLAVIHPICYLLVLGAAIPAAIAGGWLLHRAFALRPLFAFAAAATAAAMLSEAALFVSCEFSSLGHGVLVHGAAVVTVAVFGWVVGACVGRAKRPSTL